MRSPRDHQHRRGSLQEQLDEIQIRFRAKEISRETALKLFGDAFINLPSNERQSINTLIDVLDAVSELTKDSSLIPPELGQMNRILAQANRRRLLKGLSSQKLMSVAYYLAEIGFWPQSLFAGEWLRSMHEKLGGLPGDQLTQIMQHAISAGILKHAAPAALISFIDRWTQRVATLLRASDPAVPELLEVAAKILVNEPKLTRILPNNIQQRILRLR